MKQKIIIICGVIFLLCVVLTTSFFLLSKEIKRNDVSLSWNYIGEGSAPTTFPKKEDGYQVTDVSCNHGTGTWNNEEWGVEVSNISGSIKCTVTFDDGSYQDSSGANPPELIEGLIPVTWNGSNWVKADTNSEWYNYDEQWWANAVTVTSASRSEYMNASANTIILMDDIETMWVWIPRYSYTIKSEDGTNYYGRSMPEVGGISPATRETPGAIDIKFVESNTKELGTAQYTGDVPSAWRTSDGFTFGSQELSGIWVAKFETSSESSSLCYNEANEVNCNVNTISPIVKPNVFSWRYINIANSFYVSRSLTTEDNRYGLDPKADGHMMKNSEWGVVSYLSQSKYGKYGNVDYSGESKEVYANNYNGYLTGCSAGSYSATSSSSCQYIYSVEGSGTGASTTGTIYGVYDMRGGSGERVMSNFNGNIENSGFDQLPDLKYYDAYERDNDTDLACNGGVCYSHALSEVNSWYDDYGYMEVGFWIRRGRDYYSGSGDSGGIFAYDNVIPSPYYSYTFRLVLTPAP